jgi:hypothetical protein
MESDDEGDADGVVGMREDEAGRSEGDNEDEMTDGNGDESESGDRKKRRGAVQKAFDCPVCGARIELTQLRRMVVQCDECEEWMAHDRPVNHSKDKKKVMVERERERQREKEQRKRDATKADPEAYAKSLQENRERHAKRRAPGGDEEPTPENLAKRNAAYAAKRSVGALASSKPELLEQLREKRREEYMRKVADGEAYFQRVRKDPVLYAEYLRKMRERRLDYAKICPICDKRHESKIDDWCRDCRTGQRRAKVYETEVANFFRDNGMEWASSDQKIGCDPGDDYNVRPDFVFKAPGVANIVIVEVDEDQHRSYPLECEIARMAKVRDTIARESAVGIGTDGSPGMGIIVIRYNPERTAPNNNNRPRITHQSKVLLLDCLHQALKRGPSSSILGYEQVFLGYDESRVAEFLHTELRMHIEKQESFNSSSPGSCFGTDTTLDTIDLLMKHNDDFINRVREMKKKEKAQRHAKREADRRAVKKNK